MEMSKKPTICDICNRPFATYWTMNRHKHKIHNQPTHALETYTEFIEKEKTKELQLENIEMTRDMDNITIEILQMDIEQLQNKVNDLENQLFALRFALPQMISDKINSILYIEENGND